MTLTFELDLYTAKLNQLPNIQMQGHTDTQSQTHTSDQLLYLDY